MTFSLIIFPCVWYRILVPLSDSQGAKLISFLQHFPINVVMSFLCFTMDHHNMFSPIIYLHLHSFTLSFYRNIRQFSCCFLSDSFSWFRLSFPLFFLFLLIILSYLRCLLLLGSCYLLGACCLVVPLCICLLSDQSSCNPGRITIEIHTQCIIPTDYHLISQ